MSKRIGFVALALLFALASAYAQRPNTTSTLQTPAALTSLRTRWTRTPGRLQR